MNELKILDQIAAAVEGMKKIGWQTLPHNSDTWIRWRNGHTPPACNMLGALMLTFVTDERGNMGLPNPNSWITVIANGLGISVENALIIADQYEDRPGRHCSFQYDRIVFYGQEPRCITNDATAALNIGMKCHALYR